MYSLFSAVKRKMTSRCTIKLPKSGICPLCFYKTRQSNWARHVKRHHPEFTTPIYSENKNSSEQVEEINVVEPAQSSSKSSEIDLPMLQLKHFLNQQIQHNNLFGVDNEDKEGLGEEDEEQIRIIKEVDGNNGEEEGGEEYSEEAQKADELLFKGR
ncbi:unnamed protein product [Meloidogyne enterolobii]|uniref:Uncharacterized protein n=1 Tax=Meloidogyne enterolobii TaxID=390850 RepID=A0ACB1A866_MELEN